MELTAGDVVDGGGPVSLTTMYLADVASLADLEYLAIRHRVLLSTIALSC